MDASQKNTILQAILNLSNKIDTLEKRVEEEKKKNDNFQGQFLTFSTTIENSFSLLNSNIDKFSEDNAYFKNEIKEVRRDINLISFTTNNIYSNQYIINNILRRIWVNKK